MQDTISRRSVAKGAAWAVPAISVAASAPALAVSPLPGTIACPDQSCFENFASASPSFTMTTSGVRIGACNGFGGSNYGTYVNMTLGNYRINQSTCPMPSNALYFVFQATSITAVDQSGVTHTGKIVDQCGSGSASACGALGVYSGGTISLQAQFNDFVGWSDCTANSTWSSSHYLKSYTINYTLLFRDAIGTALATTPANCTYSATFQGSVPVLQSGSLSGSLGTPA